MRITYDPDGDVLYVYLNDGTDGPLREGIVVGPEQEGITADLDPEGHVVGIEVQGARARLGEHEVQSVTLELISERATTLS